MAPVERVLPAAQAEAPVVLLDWVDARAAVVTINRPAKRNACNQAAWRGLGSIFDELGREGRARIVVLTGAGGHFCAGDDIIDAGRARADPAAAALYAADLQAAFDAVVKAPFPVVAAIPGYAIGGGLSLAMCCDFRVGGPASSLGVPAAKLGFTYPLAQCARLMSLVGLSWARRIMFSGERIDAVTAQRIGLLDALSEGDLVEAAIAFAAGMRDSAPLTIAASKRIFNALATGEPERHAAEIEAFTRRIENSEDLREGARAFAEKRRPRFTGR